MINLSNKSNNHKAVNNRHIKTLFNIDKADDETYRKKMSPKLKTHLKQLLHAHLDIKNEE